MKTLKLISIVIWYDGPMFCIAEHKGTYFFCLLINDDCDYFCVPVTKHAVKELQVIQKFTDFKLRKYFEGCEKGYVTTLTGGNYFSDSSKDIKDFFTVKKILLKDEIPEEYLPGI